LAFFGGRGSGYVSPKIGKRGAGGGKKCAYAYD